MAIIKTFHDLQVWQKSHQLTLNIYKITSLFPKQELFSITNQIRRAAYSVPANIVEGFRRRSLRDSPNFYNIADASLEELKYFLLLSKDLEYFNLEIYQKILEQTEEVGRLLTGWIQSQRQYL